MESPNGDWVKLTEEELRQLVDREARRRLNMSGEVFVQRYRDGTLPPGPGVSEIGMLLKLGAI